jgi:ribosomal protein L37E
MSANMDCRSCGSKLTHLEGATGRISICSHCGWNRVELTRGWKTPGLTAGLRLALTSGEVGLYRPA